MSFLEELRWRGLLHQTAGADLEKHLATPGRIAYCGFDPTADSLTVGNFVAIKLLMQENYDFTIEILVTFESFRNGSMDISLLLSSNQPRIFRLNLMQILISRKL